MNGMLRVSLLLGCALLLAANAAFCQTAPVEPVYKGRSLESWLRDLRIPERREEATLALRNLEPSPVPILVERLKRSGLDRGMAIQALTAMGPAAKSAIPDLAKMISDPLSPDAKPIILILSHLGDDAVPVLIEALKKIPVSDSPNPRMMQRDMQRGTLVTALGRMGLAARAAIPIFREDLKSADGRARNCVTLALSGMSQDPEANSLLIDCLKDPDETTRRNAAFGLGGPHPKRWSLKKPPDFNPMTNAPSPLRANPAAVAGLRHMAEYDDSSNSRQEATDTLMRIDPQATLDEFIKNLQSPDLTVRRNCAWNLNYFKKGGKPAIPALVKCLADGNAEVRKAAVVALREIGEQPEIVVPVLTKTLSDSESGVREVAAIALGAFGESSKGTTSNIVDILKNTTNELMAQGLFNALCKIDPITAERLLKEQGRKIDPVETTGAPETIVTNEIR